MPKQNAPLAALRHHVSGAIARGEKEAIVEVPDTRERFSFDGFGINGPDKYRSRILTCAPGLLPDKYAKEICEAANAYPRLVAENAKLIAALRDALAACDKAQEFSVHHGSGVAQARALLAEVSE